MHKPSSLRDYLVASTVAGALFVLFAIYLFFRRGYFLDAPVTTDMLYVPNKALASTAMVLLGGTFLIGPLTRYFDRFDSWLSYRKEIGIMAGFLAILHGVISYYALPKKFPQEWMDFQTPEFAAGLVGVIILTILFLFSFKKVLTAMSGGRWWFFQRWGLRTAVIATLVHVYAMKWQSWVRWFTVSSGSSSPELINSWLPGLSMLTIVFITWVVIVRLYESVFLFRDFGFTTKEISMDPALKLRGRRFLIRSAWILVILCLVILIRWVTV